jgi:hypothetical protein
MVLNPGRKPNAPDVCAAVCQGIPGDGTQAHQAGSGGIHPIRQTWLAFPGIMVELDAVVFDQHDPIQFQNLEFSCLVKFLITVSQADAAHDWLADKSESLVQFIIRLWDRDQPGVRASVSINVHAPPN